MLDVIAARIRQKYRTIRFPDPDLRLPERYRGLPSLDSNAAVRDRAALLKSCPYQAVTGLKELRIDLGKCIFCTDCTKSGSSGAIRFTGDYRLAVRKREDLVTGGGSLNLAAPLEEARLKLFKKSFKIRQVSAGGCNACEADLNVLSTLAFDIGRFGIQFTASPRHADAVLVTGPVTANMKTALEKTIAATPDPRVIIASGTCAVSGGPYAGHPECAGGVDALFPVDLFIPGCPPHPLTVLDGLLRLLGRISE